MSNISVINIDKIISLIQFNEHVANKLEKIYEKLSTLPNEIKTIVANDHLLICKLLSSQLKCDRFLILKIFEPYIKKLSCTKFIDLLWLLRRDLTTNGVDDMNEEIELLIKFVDIDSSNYHIVMNLFNEKLNNIFYMTDTNKVRIIFSYVFKILKQNKIIISEKFMLYSTVYIKYKSIVEFLIMCIEHNKTFGVNPNNKIIRLLDFDSWKFDNVDIANINNLIDNFKNVDPEDVKKILNIGYGYDPKLFKYLIENINFDIKKLARLTFADKLADIEDFNKKKLANENNKLIIKKRKIINKNKELHDTNTEIKLVEMFDDSCKIDELNDNISDKELDNFCKYETEGIRIELDGVNIKTVEYIERICRYRSMFSFYFTKDIEISVPNDTYMHYESLVKNNRFIRVLSKNHQIEIIICDMNTNDTNNTNNMKVYHHYITKSKNHDKYKNININKKEIESINMDSIMNFVE